MEKGKWQREKTICPDCGRNVFIPMHKKYCTGIKENSIPENNISDDINKENKLEVFSDIEIVSENDENFPLIDSSFGESVKRQAGNIAKHIKGQKPISKQKFRELITHLNKVFIFFDVPEYCLTDDDLDLIVDDLYYLIGKYFPEFLKYLSNDLIVIGRLITNILYIAKTKYIMHQIKIGKLTPESMTEHINEIVNSDDMKPFKDMVEKMGINLNQIAEQIKNNKTDKTESTQEIKTYNHNLDNIKQLESNQEKIKKDIEKLGD